jgi:hypothetical protein
MCRKLRIIILQRAGVLIRLNTAKFSPTITPKTLFEKFPRFYTRCGEAKIFLGSVFEKAPQESFWLRHTLDIS